MCSQHFDDDLVLEGVKTYAGSAMIKYGPAQKRVKFCYISLTYLHNSDNHALSDDSTTPDRLPCTCAHSEHYSLQKPQITNTRNLSLCPLAYAAVAKQYIRGVLCQKQVSRTGTCNYITQYMWDVITCPCPWYLFLAQHSSYNSPGFNSLCGPLMRQLS